MPMISEHVKMLILFGSFCNDRYCLFLVIIEMKFYLGDIRDRTFIDSVFEKEEIDGVIHFAANSQVGESMVNPLKYYNNNLCGTEVLLESMVAHGINKIVFFRDRTARYNCCTGISSDCVSTLHGKIEFGRKE